jgi:hypothetical protein
VRAELHEVGLNLMSIIQSTVPLQKSAVSVFLFSFLHIMQTFQNERNLYRSGPRAYPAFLPPTLKYSASGEAHQIRVQISEQKIKIEKRAKFQKVKLKTVFFV